MGESLHGQRSADFSPWGLVVGPAIWAAHLLLSYATVAIWCAKVAGPGGTLGGVRWAVAVYTALALIGTGLVGVVAWRRQLPGAGDPSRDIDTPASRERFVAFATLLLAGLSAVAVAFAGMAVAFLGDCR
jgi:hypothetical protein